MLFFVFICQALLFLSLEQLAEPAFEKRFANPLFSVLFFAAWMLFSRLCSILEVREKPYFLFLIAFFTLSVVLLLTFFKLSVVDALLWGAAFTAFISVMDIFAATITGFFFSEDATALYLSTGVRKYRGVSLFMGLRCLLFVLCQIKRKRRLPVIRLPEKLTLLFCSVLAMAASVAVRSASASKVFENLSALRAVFLFCLLLILTVAAFLWILLNLNDDASEKIMAQKMAYYEEYLEKVKANFETTAKINHDYRKHLRVLANLSENAEREELRAYLQEITGDFDAVFQQIFTGNLAVDAILSDKKMRAEKNGIRFEVNAQYSKSTKLPDKELCAVLFNLLDNAIEACERRQDPENFIEFYMGVRGGMAVIKCLNSAPEPENSPSSRSHEKDPVLHGYGLKIIRSIVKKHHGNFSFKCDEKTAETLILLGLE